jgi:site-specific DNA-methyltransferase (adenine-specific)
MAYKFLNADCFDWMQTYSQDSITAIVTDPPYGVKEYSDIEIDKKRNGCGGVWRIPPSFDGHKRQPLPRFSVINDDAVERENVYQFFYAWAKLAIKLLVPGGHVFIASTPLLSDILSRSMRDAGFERRGEIIRTVVTFRGGDRPKGAEEEFRNISVIPRGVWEPWGLYRKPISEKTVAKNLRKWKAGALRRENDGTPFCDLIESIKTPRIEREIAPHPSIKPQLFLRKIVRAALPLSSGVVLDTFAGSGSTLAAAEYLGLDSIGTEKDSEFFSIGQIAIPQLANLYSTKVVSGLGQVTFLEENTYS